MQSKQGRGRRKSETETAREERGNGGGGSWAEKVNRTKGVREWQVERHIMDPERVSLQEVISGDVKQRSRGG